MRVTLIALLMFGLAGCADDQKKLADAQAQIAQLRAENASLKDTNEQLAANLVRSGKTPVLSSASKFDLSVPIRPGPQTPPDSKWTLDVNAANVVDAIRENQTIHTYNGVIVGSGTRVIGNESPTTLPTTKPATAK